MSDYNRRPEFVYIFKVRVRFALMRAKLMMCITRVNFEWSLAESFGQLAFAEVESKCNI